MSLFCIKYEEKKKTTTTKKNKKTKLSDIGADQYNQSRSTHSKPLFIILYNFDPLKPHF